MSGGRVEFGLGTGWFEAEHTAYGIPFPPLGERFDRSRSSWRSSPGCGPPPDGETFSFEGTHYQLTDSPALPKPAQRPRPPVILGGGRRAPHAAAGRQVRRRVQRAVPVRSGLGGRVRARPRGLRGRRPLSRVHDLLGRPDGVLREGRSRVPPPGRRDRLGARRHPRARPRRHAGEVAAKIASFAEIGAERIYLQVLDLSDLDHLGLIASDVLPQV